MKKIIALGILPVVALASCGKQQEVEVIQDSNSLVNGENLEENIEINEELNTEIISSEVGSTGIQTKYFSKSYLLPNGQEASFSGKIDLENGVVKSIEFPEIDLNGDGPQSIFAKAVGEKVIGKEIDGLQVDGISGASLTTAAFNDYLKNL